MTPDLQSISPQNPLMFTSSGEFLEAVRAYVMQSIGVPMAAESRAAIEQEYITTRQAKDILQGKGYGVKNFQIFKDLLTGIEPVKKGKTYWYRTADILAIPSRI
jgi:hypothetical protein